MFCSVAMSTYNGERFLAEQLASVCTQTRPVDEIVVSDDGSSDGTLRILDEFRRAHPEIRWHVLTSEQNHGFRASFLRAIRACSGEILFLCDQDDRWAPGKVETMLRYFEANPAMLSLISDFKTIDANGNLLNPSAPTENLWVSDRVLRAPSAPVQISLSEMLGRNQGQGCAMAVRRELAQEYIRLDQLWTHDWILNLLAALHGGLYYCPDQLLFYRLHGSNVIGMAQGEHAQRHIPFIRRPYELALAFKYSFLQGNPAASRKELISIPMETYESVFARTDCAEAERIQRDRWKALQTKRLRLIEKRKPLAYLAFFLTHRQFFKEIAYFSTFEQFAIRLMIDLCAMRKGD